MVFDLCDQFLIKECLIGCHPETAIVFVPTCTTGDLGKFGRCQFAVTSPVKFSLLCKGNQNAKGRHYHKLYHGNEFQRMEL